MRPPLLGVGNTPGFGGFSTTGTPRYNAPPASSSAGRRRILPGAQGPIFADNISDEDAQAYLEQWNQYVAETAAMVNASSGFDRRKLEAQLADAEKGRQNAMAIARLSSETSRYGVDVGRQNTLDQLKENARQFDANHGLEQQRLGLTYAQTATDYLSTPDRYFQAGNYLNMASRVFAGQPGAAPYGSTGTPTPKTEQDFAILARGGNPYGGQTPRAGQLDVTQAAAAGGSGADARVKALKAMIDAVPPSNNDGLDPNDFAVMQAARALYSTNLTPKQYQTITSDPDFLGVTNSALRTGGHNPEAWHAQQRRQGIGQGSVRTA
jgi:hypothetical protein